MRYPAERKEETRRKILQTAARRFRASGGSVGIADLMKELDLTHGGFYRHFDSKDQLFAESFESGLEDIRSSIAKAVENAPKGGELRALIEAYLSEAHCANIANGCPVAALAGEVARAPRKVKQATDRWVRDHIARVSRFLPGASDEERQRNAFVLFSGMAGTLSVARAVADKSLRAQILEDGRRFYVEAFRA